MWMMGYNDGGDFNMPDSFNGRKLRPLMPRVPHAPTPTTCLRGIHGDNFIALNHHQLAMSEQNKRDFNTQQLVVSSRWNPTPEQLQTLEELYRRGTRTPSAEQIQHITAQLRRYGKIEGKNVFYWFQNHKARERQKRRRQLESAANNGAAAGDDYSNTNSNAENAERKESGANRTVFEIEQTKHWPSPTNCSTLAEKTAATTKAGGGGGVAESCRAAAAERWIPFDESEQRRSLLAERNATWQMMHLSCSVPTNTNTIHLMTNINSSNAPTICSNAITATTSPITSTCPSTPRTMDHHQRPKQPLKSKDHLNIFIAPFRSTCDQKHENIIGDDDEGGHGESQTLELFPLRSSNDDNNDENNFSDKDEIGGAAANSNNNFSSTTHYQFFEFLPLKNGRN